MSSRTREIAKKLVDGLGLKSVNGGSLLRQPWNLEDTINAALYSYEQEIRAERRKSAERKRPSDKYDYDLAYSVAEEMGLGFKVRNCSCGELPCARLKPIVTALQHREQEVREQCAQIAETIPESIFDNDHEPAPTEQQIRNGIAAMIRHDNTSQGKGVKGKSK
jgi:hypothetical protein